MTRLALFLTVLAACNGPRYPYTRPPESTGDTGRDPLALTASTIDLENLHLSASCAPTENVLRYLCTVWVDPPQPVEITFAKHNGTGPERTHTSDLVASNHTIPLYFMTHDALYDWTVRATNDPLIGTVGGSFTPLQPPLGARVRFEEAVGAPSSPMIGMVSPCNEGAFAVVVDPTSNDLLWYQDFALSPIGFMDAVTFTDDHTVLAIADGALREVDLMGAPKLDLFPSVDLEYRVHHDVFRKDGWTYALFQELVVLGDADYLLDGFYIIDELGTIIAEWHLVNHFIPSTPGPGQYYFAQDFSHANAIWVDDQQNVLISFRHLSAIAMIQGDPASPDFGTIEWRLANPTSPFGSDFALTSAVGPPADFERQHNAHFLPDGSLVMLDNRIPYYEMTRVLKLSVNTTSFEAAIVREFLLPNHCDFQGGAMLTPTGNMLATCAPSRNAYEFDDETGALDWEATAACTVGFGTFIPRFVPLDW